ncbi:MAG: oxidoreductase [Gammaproteobacteria bacterium]|mgnify:CR=1 FL=1|nr:oxidoreductase [Gammaproteobacteria bacterium]|tara:strand:- start:4854 stop:5837 length:984 start_codon:yes stop_codon:yes gene_type:complete
MSISYRALESSVKEEKYSLSIVEKNTEDLPKGDLLIKVRFSCLNYKDAMSATGIPGVTKEYPHTPGIDAVGEIVQARQGQFKEGDLVIVSGYDLGMNTPGGFAEYISVPHDWAISLPSSLSPRDSMILGTAGLTAGLSVAALESFRGLENTKSVVSGSTGGVGSISTMLLSQLGSSVTAISGKKETEFLNTLGASSVINRTDLLENIKKPISKGLWDIGVDVVGGDILSTLLAALNPGGAIACSGLVGGTSFESSIFPFILRGNALIGIDSVEIPLSNKEKIWNKLASEWSISNLSEITKEVSLESMEDEINTMLKGQQVGRVVLKI